MNTKKQLKTELALESVTVINTLLKAAGRPTDIQRSTSIEAADERLVRAAIPHLNAGKSPSEAVKLAKSEIRGAEMAAEEEDTPVGNSTNDNGNASALSPYQKAQIQNNLQRKKDEATALRQVAQDAVEFAEKLEEARWLLVAASRSSDQVQSSDRVTKAREFALGISDGGLDGNSHIQGIDSYLEDLGFFSSLDAPSLNGHTSNAALPDYSESAN
jgi:ParB-like chromosome segregation protein Spo0J